MTTRSNDHYSSTSGHYSSTSGHHRGTCGHYSSTSGHYRSTSRHYSSTSGHYRSTRGHYSSTSGHYSSTSGHYISTSGHYSSTRGRGTTAAPGGTTAAPAATTAAPAATTAAPGATTAAPGATTSAPGGTTAGPVGTTAAPAATTAAPAATTAAPGGTTAAPAATTAAPVATTAAPVATTAAPAATTQAATTSAEVATTKARPQPERKIVPSVLTMQRTFRDDLRDETSRAFLELSVAVTESLTAVHIRIRGFLQIIIIGFVPGSVQARYVAVFDADQAEPDTVIHQQVRENLTEAITAGSFNSSLNVTAVQPTTLTAEELNKLAASGSPVCTLRCGEGGRCQLTEKYPGVLIAECVCEPDYCTAGTCDVIVDQGPRCTCPATMGSWYRGERCDHVLTQGHVIAIALSCTCAVLLLLFMVAVCMAKREKNVFKEKKEERYRYAPPGIVLENYNVHNPEDGQHFPRAALGRDDYPPTGSEMGLFPAKSPLYTDSIRDRGKPRWNPLFNNLPTGQFKIPRPATQSDKVYPEDDDRYFQSFEIDFSQPGGEETKM
ncbi:PREDICTED: mucin-17-like [Branchiostoma belcheri]|uniref:Mucin-17-like n=1 Tax=Branchiostoma belcheri TaxID=7741 RepID=A0A6P4ZLG9_BRABE|nr:PREDICTED: mucin-17-like [Branchiostoma belcheri]